MDELILGKRLGQIILILGRLYFSDRDQAGSASTRIVKMMNKQETSFNTFLNIGY